MQTFNFVKNRNPLRKVYKATVTDITDPLKMGRIKVSIPNIFGTEIAANTPWIYPLGYNCGVRLFNVPNLNSQVFVFFINADVYSGFYAFGNYPQTESKVFDTDYPDTYGFEDSLGNYLTINKVTGDVKFHHYSGTEIDIDSNGDFKLTHVSGSYAEFLDEKLVTTSCDILNLVATTQINLVTPLVAATALITAESNISSTAGNVADKTSTMQAMRDVYNMHTNPPGGGTPQKMT